MTPDDRQPDDSGRKTMEFSNRCGSRTTISKAGSSYTLGSCTVSPTKSKSVRAFASAESGVEKN